MCQVYKRWQNKLEPRWTNHTEWEAVTCIWVGGYCLIFSFSLWFFSSPNMCSCRCHACSHVWFCIFLLVVLLNTYYKGGTAYWGLGSQRTTERDVISVPMELKGPAGEALTMPTSWASVHGTRASGGSTDHANQSSQHPPVSYSHALVLHTLSYPTPKLLRFLLLYPHCPFPCQLLLIHFLNEFSRLSRSCQSPVLSPLSGPSLFISVVLLKTPLLGAVWAPRNNEGIDCIICLLKHCLFLPLSFCFFPHL